MALPTRADFLATGLVPVQNSTDGCPICMTEPMESPVQLPCKHAFCKGCITEWLEQPSTSSCAMCRKTLFTTEEANAAPVMNDHARLEQATRALRASGLASIRGFGTPFPDNAPFSTVETFDIPFYRPQLVTAAVKVFAAVTHNILPHAAGTAVFNPGTLAATLIATANMLKHMAIQQGRPYATAGNPLAEIVKAVWRILNPMQGTHVDALTVPGMVMSTLRRQFASSMELPVGIFFRDAAAGQDLEMLVGMVVVEARHQHVAESAASGTASRPPTRVFPRSTRRSNHRDALNHGHADVSCSVM